jgi:hypothetical protein
VGNWIPSMGEFVDISLEDAIDHIISIRIRPYDAIVSALSGQATAIQWRGGIRSYVFLNAAPASPRISYGLVRRWEFPPASSMPGGLGTFRLQ